MRKCVASVCACERVRHARMRDYEKARVLECESAHTHKCACACAHAYVRACMCMHEHACLRARTHMCVHVCGVLVGGAASSACTRTRPVCRACVRPCVHAYVRASQRRSVCRVRAPWPCDTMPYDNYMYISVAAWNNIAAGNGVRRLSRRKHCGAMQERATTACTNARRQAATCNGMQRHIV